MNKIEKYVVVADPIMIAGLLIAWYSLIHQPMPDMEYYKIAFGEIGYWFLVRLEIYKSYGIPYPFQFQKLDEYEAKRRQEWIEKQVKENND